MSNIIQNSNEILNGKFITYHDNGNIKEKGTYIDGMLQGVFHEFDEDGKLIVQSHWKDHKLDGKFTHWRDITTGLLYETTMYSNDIRLYSSTFDSNSVISANYYYNSDGQLISSVEYKRHIPGFIVVATATKNPRSYDEECIAYN
jgi:antitoxin component YwqK of YwqJK toxin-antitoxin module